MTDKTEEKRRFTRVLHDSHVTLTNDDGTWETQLIDISLKGALVVKPGGWRAAQGDTFTLDIELGDHGDIVIQMEGAAVAHSEKDSVGFECLDIDVNSISHLKRLMELNLGDADLIHRELHALGKLSWPLH